ncbi:MAG TPA: YbdD/YjiX family protein [Microlunatus sp.]|nr:YbdD/YjiX family protein [Microlunatus sp.]
MSAATDPAGPDANPAGPATDSAGPAAVLGRAWRAVRWYVTAVMGDNAYRVYLDHQRAHHPGEPVLSERDFWRSRTDDQERNPQGRCC